MFFISSGVIKSQLKYPPSPESPIQEKIGLIQASIAMLFWG
jgi:hypothetical protein